MNNYDLDRKVKKINSNEYVSTSYETISNIINRSKKPILYVGQGCKNAYLDLRSFAIENKIPVTTTLHGMGIFDETHDYALHMCGMHGLAAANYALQEADCIIAVGSRFDDRTTGNIDKYAPNCKNFIHLNIERSEVNKVVNTNSYIIGDLKDTLPKLRNTVKDLGGMYYDVIMKKNNDISNCRDHWLYKIKKWKNDVPFKHDILQDGKLKTQDVLIELNKQITDNMSKYIVTTGVGNHQMMSCQFINWKYPGSIYFIWKSRSYGRWSSIFCWLSSCISK